MWGREHVGAILNQSRMGACRCLPHLCPLSGQFWEAFVMALSPRRNRPQFPTAVTKLDNTLCMNWLPLLPCFPFSPSPTPVPRAHFPKDLHTIPCPSSSFWKEPWFKQSPREIMVSDFWYFMLNLQRTLTQAFGPKHTHLWKVQTKMYCVFDLRFCQRLRIWGQGAEESVLYFPSPCYVPLLCYVCLYIIVT